MRQAIESTIQILNLSEYGVRIVQDLTEKVSTLQYASHAEFAAERDQLLLALQMPMLPLLTHYGSLEHTTSGFCGDK